MLRYATAVACALGLLLTPAAGSSLPASTPLLVQFDQLIWAYSAEGMPYQDHVGTVYLPLQTTCDLIGAHCQTDPRSRKAQLQQGDQQRTITQLIMRPGALSAIQGVIAGQRHSPERSPALTATATATIHPLPHGPSTVELTLTGRTSIRTIWSYWKQVTGGIGSSSPAACRQLGTTSICQVNIPKDAVIVLASMKAR